MATFAARVTEQGEFVDIGDEQGAAVVRDAEDLELMLFLILPEEWGVVTTTDLEPNR